MLAVWVVSSSSGAAAGTWTPLANRPPDNVDTMLLLTDGTVMAASGEPRSGNIGNAWFRLTPDIHGSYVNGTWSVLAPMNDARLYYSSQVLLDGRVFIAGGEYGVNGLLSANAATAEIYDPLANAWTRLPDSGQTFLDSGSEILPDGRVLVAPVFPSVPGNTIIYDPVANSWSAGIPLVRGSDQDEASWVKLPDDSILSIDPFGTNSERFIPTLNKWVDDGVVPVPIYDAFDSEMGAGFLLADGRAFFLGDAGATAIYTPSGTTSPGTWTAGAPMPNGLGVPDAPAAMMVNGRILCAFSPVPATNGDFPTPTTFYEYDPVANNFTSINGPIGPNLPQPTFVNRMLVLPDGTILLSTSTDQLFVYQSSGAPLASGKPSIISITQNSGGSYHLTGKNLNGISEGAAYGDDVQVASNYPLIRLVDASGNVFYARSLNRSSTSVMTGNAILSTDFTVPADVPPRNYSLFVVANGNSSDPVPFTPVPAPDLVIVTNILSGGNGNGMIDFDECNTMDFVLANLGSADATGVRATLSTSTPGVVISQRANRFPDIPVGFSATNLTSFKVSTSPLFVCGTPIDFTLVITSDQNTVTRFFRINTGVPGTPVRFDNNAVVLIPPGDPLGATSPVVVTNINAALQDVVVALTIQHQLDFALTLQLVGPDGTTVTLSQNNGSGANFGNDCLSDADRTIFDDSSSNSIANGTPPFVGIFHPDQPLAAFAGKSGTNVNGTWKLLVIDNLGVTSPGFIECWSLILTPAACVDGGGQCPGTDLAVGMTAAPNPIVVGNNLTYTISVTNNGPDTATVVAINQSLPSSVVFVTATTSQGSVTHNGNTVSCNVGSLLAGGRATINVTVQTTAPGVLFSSVSVGGVQPDPDPSNNSATTATQVNEATADIGLSLSAAPNPVLLGGVLAYKVTVTNNGPSTATSVLVTNLLPPSVSFISAAPSQGVAADNGATVVWTLGSLPKNASASLTISARVSTSPSALGTISDTAGVTAHEPDPVPGNNTATALVQVTPAADLALGMTGNPSSAIYPSNITYTLTLLNLGPSTATNVTVSDSLPINTSYVSATPSLGTASRNGSIVTWNVTPTNSLPLGANASLTIVVATTPLSNSLPSTVTNSATVSSGLADPDLSNNSASVTTTVDVATNRIAAAGRVLVAEGFVPHNGAIDPGESVTVALILKNVGNIPSPSDVIATLLPTGGVNTNSGPQVSDYGVMPPGAPTTNLFSFTAGGTNGGIITATLQLQGGATNAVQFTFSLPAIANFSNPTTIIIPDSGPGSPFGTSINVSGLTNPIGKVTVTLTNLNHTFSDDVSILLVGPSGSGSQKVLLLSHVGGVSGVTNANVTFDDAASQPLFQSSQIISGTYQPSVYGTWPTNVPAGPYGSALASYNGSLANGTWSLFVYDSSPGDAGIIIGGWSLGITTVQPVNQVADLALIAMASPSPVLGGSNLTCTFTITNGGPNTASGVAFTNFLPSNVSYVTASSIKGAPVYNPGLGINGAVTCTFSNNLAVNAAGTVVVVTTPNPGTTSVTNTASVAGNETDLNTVNNSVQLVTPVNIPHADLVLGISAAPNPVLVGGNLSFSVTVTNNGPDTAFGVVVTNPLPAALAFAPGLSSSSVGAPVTNAGGVIICNIGPLASGAGVLVTIGAVPQQGGTITNVAGVRTDSSDANLANNSASIVVSASAPAPLIIVSNAIILAESRVPANRAIDPGETVTVSFLLANVGSADVGNLKATLQNGGGVTSLSPQLTYGPLVHGGAAVSNSFQFSASGVNGGVVIATLQLQDGGSALPPATFTFNLPMTNTFVNSSAIVIPAIGPGNPYPSTINVSGMTGLVSSVTATVSNLSHTFPHDINVLLVSPSGRKTLLISHAGGAHAVSNVTVTADDTAAAPLPNFGQIVSGTFLPTAYAPAVLISGPAPAGPYVASMAALNGADPNGTWSLFVFDDSAGDDGNIAAGWSMTIATVSPVNPVADLGIVVANPAGAVSAGNNFKYTVTVSNGGPAAASGVVVADVLPPGVNFVTASAPNGFSSGSGTATLNFGSIAPNTSAFATITVNAPSVGTYTNTASVAADQSDLNQSNNSTLTSTVVAAFVPPSLGGSTFHNDGSFTLTLTGQPNQTYVIDASTDFLNWSPVSTNTASAGGKFQFTDSNVGSYTQRFFRARVLPQ